MYTDDENSVAQSPSQQPGGASARDRCDTSSASRQRVPVSGTPYRKSSGGIGDPRKMRPPSPYLSALPNYDSRPATSSSITPASRQMGRPQSGSSFVLSSVDTAWSARRRPPSVSSQISDEPRRLLDAKVSRKRSAQDYQLMVRAAVSLSECRHTRSPELEAWAVVWRRRRRRSPSPVTSGDWRTEGWQRLCKVDRTAWRLPVM